MKKRLLLMSLLILVNSSLAKHHSWIKPGGNPCGKDVTETLSYFKVDSDPALDQLIKDLWLKQIANSSGARVYQHPGTFYNQMTYGGQIKWTQFGVLDSVTAVWATKDTVYYDSLEAVLYVAQRISSVATDTTVIITTREWRLYVFDICNNATWNYQTSRQTIYRPKFSLSGYVIFDKNGNRLWEETEKGLTDWTVVLENAFDGEQLDSAATDSNGFYKFNNLTSGSYLVREKVQEKYIPTSDTLRIVVIDQQDIADVNFLNTLPVPPLEGIIEEVEEKEVDEIFSICYPLELESFHSLGLVGNYPYTSSGGRITLYPCAVAPYLGITAKLVNSYQASYEPISGLKDKLNWEGTYNSFSYKFGLKLQLQKRGLANLYFYLGKDRYRYHWNTEYCWEIETIFAPAKRWKIEAIASGYPGPNYLWSRGRIKYQFTRWSKGFWNVLGEAYYEGDDNLKYPDFWYQRSGGGLEYFRPFGKVSWWSAMLHGGRGTFGWYLGAEFNIGTKLSKTVSTTK